MRIPTMWRQAVACAAGLLLLAVQAGWAQDTEADARRLAGRDVWRTDFSRHSVPLHEIVSGGPGKDGIPAIDQPRFEDAAEAGRWLGSRDPVVVIAAGGIVKGYPLSILIWHEIVNDDIGGIPVTVTFCPLCNTALAFDRRLDGRVLDFGTTGSLRHSDLVMYDRQTETWWQQAVGEGIVGELTGRKLELVSANTLGWETARRLYPDIQVLSRDTGFPRYRDSGRYGTNPYTGYDRPGNKPFGRFFSGRTDPRRPAMERVVGLDMGDGWAAAFGDLREARVINAVVDGRSVAVFWLPGAASALDETRIAESRDVGQTAVFERTAAGRKLDFLWKEGAFTDRQTGSKWNLAGHATEGPLAGNRLSAVPHGNHFWFAWVVFRPETEVWSP
ncbi:MAG: DUF3179 domain-containing protein [Gemmatimonadota bacterium]